MFFFSFRGSTYTSCTREHDPDAQAWCSTKVAFDQISSEVKWVDPTTHRKLVFQKHILVMNIPHIKEESFSIETCGSLQKYMYHSTFDHIISDIRYHQEYASYFWTFSTQVDKNGDHVENAGAYKKIIRVSSVLLQNTPDVHLFPHLCTRDDTGAAPDYNNTFTKCILDVIIVYQWKVLYNYKFVLKGSGAK